MDRYFTSEESWDSKKIESAARISEVLSFRWAICGGNAQELEGIYQKASSILYSGKYSSEAAFIKAQRFLEDALPSDNDFANALQTKVIKSNQRGHYILRKIDQWNNREGAYVLMGPSELQLEHVAPRKPTKSSDWLPKIGEADYSDTVCQIGNMILLKKKPNREGSNKSFKEKLKIYKNLNKDNYPGLSSEILTYKDWNTDVIQERSQRIAQLALNVWSVSAVRVQGKSVPKKSKSKLTTASRKRKRPRSKRVIKSK